MQKVTTKAPKRSQERRVLLGRDLTVEVRSAHPVGEVVKGLQDSVERHRGKNKVRACKATQHRSISQRNLLAEEDIP